MSIELLGLPPTAFEAWTVVFALAEEFYDHWVVVGGQMVALHAAEHGLIEMVRPTNDIDVIVNIRAPGASTQLFARWLTGAGFEFDGASPDNIGHRYTRPASPGPGMILFDVLAPEGVGAHASLLTTRPARTIEVPGGTQALDRAELIEVTVTPAIEGKRATGRVRRPNLLGAIVAKAAATTIAVRDNPQRDWQDAALLLACIKDPFELTEQLTTKDRMRLAALAPLDDPNHNGWLLLSDNERRRGRTALEIVTSPRS